MNADKLFVIFKFESSFIHFIYYQINSSFDNDFKIFDYISFTYSIDFIL